MIVLNKTMQKAVDSIKAGAGIETDPKNSQHITMCPCSSLPSKKEYRETQFSTIKRRTGRESVPFLGLEPGIHLVKFYTEKKSILRYIETWVSMYGDAWIILKKEVKKDELL